MRVLTWEIRLAIFLFLLAFAARNTDPVTLRFYFDLAWQMPLVALLLAFFVAGALLGVAAAIGVLIRQRREIGRLERDVRHATRCVALRPRPKDERPERPLTRNGIRILVAAGFPGVLRPGVARCAHRHPAPR